MRNSACKIEDDYFSSRPYTYLRVAADSTPAEYSGERVLWVNVLVMGIRDAVMGVPGVRFSARQWLFANDPDSVGSFLWICATLGIGETEKIRRKVRYWIRNRPRRKFRTV